MHTRRFRSHFLGKPDFLFQTSALFGTNQNFPYLQHLFRPSVYLISFCFSCCKAFDRISVLTVFAFITSMQTILQANFPSSSLSWLISQFHIVKIAQLLLKTKSTSSGTASGCGLTDMSKSALEKSQKKVIVVCIIRSVCPLVKLSVLAL